MKKYRVWLVYGILFVIVAGHLVEVALQREHWPFSNYPMWSIPSRTWEIKREMMRGVTAGADPREVAITPDQLYPLPYQLVVVNMQHAAAAAAKMEQAHARAAELKAKDDPGWKKAQDEADKRKVEAERIVGGLLRHYNNRLKAGKHAGPELKELRLYQVFWMMDVDASEASKKNPLKTVLRYPLLTPEEAASAVPPVSTQLVSEFGDDSNE